MLVLRVISGVLLVLNMFGGVVAFVWLIILGHWGIIGYGVAGMFLSSWILPLLLGPTVATGTGCLLLARSRSTFGWAGFVGLMLLNTLYIYALMAAWILVVFTFYENTTSHLVPILLWSYAGAVGPWSWMAKQDSGGGDAHAPAALAVWTASLGSLTLVLVRMFSDVLFATQIWLLGGAMLPGMIFAFIYGVISVRQMRQEGTLDNLF